MSVWYAVPSIRPGGGTCPAWKAAGYRVAVVRQGEPFPEADLTIPTDHYRGWSSSINLLAKRILADDPSAEWIVSGGDDTLPDPYHTPGEIAWECSAHCEVTQTPMRLDLPPAKRPMTFLVMQPTGDLKLWPGSAIDKFAGSPWMGREWCERAYQGNGPMFDGYAHLFGDEELQCVAEKLGVFWQRPDLIHKHLHWGRPESRADIPEFLQYINSTQHWNESKALFESRRAAGFPSHEPLAAAMAGGA